MPLATRNGALIVKADLIAENCNCCLTGWYCSVEQCPCNYTKRMPSTLKATIGFNVSANIYGLWFGQFAGASYMGCTRITTSQASTVNGTYTLTREGQSSCFYSYSSDTVSVRVSVGSQSGSLNGQQYQNDCGTGNVNVHVVGLSLSVPNTRSRDTTFGQYGSLVPGSVSNAASKDYTEDYGSYMPAAPSYSVPADVAYRIPYEKRISAWYNSSMGIDGAPSAVDSPACKNGEIDTINHLWRYDVVYTKTDGEYPENGRLSRAVSVLIEE